MWRIERLQGRSEGRGDLCDRAGKVYISAWFLAAERQKMRKIWSGLVAGLVGALGAGGAWAGETLAADAAFREASEGRLVLIDVRTEGEWRDTGVPLPAIGVTLQDDDFVEQVSRVLGDDRTRPVAVICRSGTRSGRAAARLEAAGFSRVLNVSEGLIGRQGVGPGWLERKLPLKDHPGETK